MAPDSESKIVFLAQKKNKQKIYTWCLCTVGVEQDTAWHATSFLTD